MGICHRFRRLAIWAKKGQQQVQQREKGVLPAAWKQEAVRRGVEASL
jgi:hypothetical protein